MLYLHKWLLTDQNIEISMLILLLTLYLHDKKRTITMPLISVPFKLKNKHQELNLKKLTIPINMETINHLLETNEINLLTWVVISLLLKVLFDLLDSNKFEKLILSKNQSLKLKLDRLRMAKLTVSTDSPKTTNSPLLREAPQILQWSTSLLMNPFLQTTVWCLRLTTIETSTYLLYKVSTL